MASQLHGENDPATSLTYLRMCFHSHLHHHPKSAASSTAKSIEDVSILASIGSHICTGWKHRLELQGVVYGQAIQRR